MVQEGATALSCTLLILPIPFFLLFSLHFSSFFPPLFSFSLLYPRPYTVDSGPCRPRTTYTLDPTRCTLHPTRRPCKLKLKPLTLSQHPTP